MQSLNKDEKSLDENLDFIGKSMNAILLSRKDTFKEHITRAYALKEFDAEYYKERCEEMEKHEEMYKKNLEDRENLAYENLQLKKELAYIKHKSAKDSSILSESVAEAHIKISQEEKTQSLLT